MGFKSLVIRPFAKAIARNIRRMGDEAVARQERLFRDLRAKASNTAFGRDHHLDEVQTQAEFAQAVPIRDYEDLRPYIERIMPANPMCSGRAAPPILPKLPAPLPASSTYP